MDSIKERNVVLECEQLLAHAMMDVACELRLIDIVDIVAFVRNDRLANIYDLISSSSELYFRPGALTFSCIADVQASWSAPPSVIFDLEFNYSGVVAFFKLQLDTSIVSVELIQVSFSDRELCEAGQIDQFALALAGARVGSVAKGQLAKG